MNKIQVYLSLLVSALTFAACSQTDDLNSLSGKTGFLVSLTDPVTVTVSRATPQELGAAAENFQIKITRSATGEVVYDGGYTSDVIHAEAGFYELAAVCGENPALALDAPYYEGKVNAKEIKTNQVTAVSIPCKVANSLLSVKYNEEKKKFSDVYSNWYVEVKVESDTVHIQDTTKSAYFRAGSSFEVYFHAVKSGETEEKSIQIEGISTSLQAAEHLILTLSPEPDRYEIPLTVTKAEIKQVTVSETLPETWLPKPKLEAEGFTDNQLSFAETETPTAVIKLNTASALQDMKLKFHFEDEQFTSLNGDKTYVLSDEADKKAVEDALGITLPAVGSESASLDLSPLVARMQTNAGTTTANTIEVDVQANGRWSSEDESANRVYTLNCSRPEFSVTVNPNNIWSKEFTIDEATVTMGNAETIKANLKYQYRESGTEAWTDCDNLLVQFAEHPTNKTYQVRGFYREGIASEPVDIELETPMQLPNSNMEEWSTSKGEEFRVSDSWLTKKTYYYFYPYTANLSDNWWDTNNLRSQDGNIILGMGHPVCFAPCVSYSETIKHGDNRSALIYTSGHGGGYTSTGEVIYEEGAFAGSLFIGSYSWSDGTETINQGHAFSVRPSAFTFYYRYYPKNTDTFKAYIELKNGDEVIASGTFIPTESSEDSDWRQATVAIDYVETPKTATSVFVQFLSTTKTEFTENDFDRKKSISFPVMGDWNAHIGSMLYIDDISLVYDK